MPDENNIKHVIIHDLRKSENGFQVVSGVSSDRITPTIQRVVDELHRLYAKRASKAHGKFLEDSVNFPVQKFLRDFLSEYSPDFGDLTLKMMKTLKKNIEARPAATGGHVFFAHFERDGQKHLLIAIVNDKLGASLSQNLELRDAQHLDLDGFRFAGRINITRWLAGEERYIGFLKGKGDVAEYFKDFLGCNTTVQDRVDTTTLVKVIKEFATNKNMAGIDLDQFLRKANGICIGLSKRHEPINFSAFANELYPDAPEELVEQLANPDLGLSDGFVPDGRSLRPLVKFKARTALWSVEFERQAMVAGKVYFNCEDNTLTLKELPQELIEELRAESEPDDEENHV